MFVFESNWTLCLMSESDHAVHVSPTSLARHDVMDSHLASSLMILCFPSFSFWRLLPASRWEWKIYAILFVNWWGRECVGIFQSLTHWIKKFFLFPLHFLSWVRREFFFFSKSKIIKRCFEIPSRESKHLAFARRLTDTLKTENLASIFLLIRRRKVILKLYFVFLSFKPANNCPILLNYYNKHFQLLLWAIF